MGQGTEIVISLPLLPHGVVYPAFRERPDVIICDIGLPGMDGYELARNLTRAAELQGCKLVAVTGYGEQRRERGHDAGFQHYIVKPADPDEIARLIVA